MINPMRQRFFLWGWALIAMAAVGPSAAIAQSSEAPDYAKLKKDYDALKVDYDNVMAQAKALLVYKTQARDAESVSRQFDMERQQLIKDKEAARALTADYQEKIKLLDAQIVKANLERDDYKKSFEKVSVENIIGEEAKKKIADFEEERRALSGKVGELERRIKAMETEALRKDAQMELQKRQIAEMKAKYEEAKKKNRILEKKIEDAPKKFAELARENKILIKRTALMHYNLGVFYTQNRDFNRALPEFEKAVEINPDDSASYFNLGYIYAEHLQNRTKAVSYFRQFLKIAKSDDKDADWVKRYILTWQTWEGKEPIN